MSLYGDYIKEHHGDGIIETQDGFATYRFLNDGKTIYIVDIYVTPVMRVTGLASTLANEIAKVGKEKGATEMLGTVVPSARQSTESLKVLLAYGMKLKSAAADLIVFRKDL